MVQKNIKGVVLGAIVGTMLGSLSAALMPKRQSMLAQTKGFAEKAKSFSDNFYNGIRKLSGPKQEEPSTFLKGAITGLLLGAGVAAFLTPKTGKQLRTNLSQKYQDIADKTQEIMQFINNEHGYALSNGSHATHHRAAPKRKSVQAKRTKAKRSGTNRARSST